MAELVFVKAECDTVDVKMEYEDEEEDPLMMTSNSTRGT